MKKQFGAADERTPSFKKTKQFAGRAGDADAHAFADGAPGIVDFAKPEFFILAEIDAIMAAIDLQRLREAAWAAREIQKPSGFAVALHDLDSFKRLQRANQNGGGGFRGLAHYIEHEVSAIIEKNVDVAGSQIHGANTRRRSTKMMSGGIARRISFGLHDAPADASGGQIVNHYFADQESCELDGVFRELGTLNPANGNFRPRLFGAFICDNAGDEGMRSPFQLDRIF